MSVYPVLNNMHARTTQAAATNKTATVAETRSAPSSGTDGSSINDISNNFMTMLVAEMQNQDPTNPMDNNELTSQLAQLNTASGISDLNKTLSGVASLVDGVQQMGAAEWIGHNVLIEGDSTVSTATEGNKEFGFSVNNDVDKVTVTLTDKEGNAYTAELKDVKSGVNKFSLDDLTNFQPSDPREIPDTSFDVSFAAANEDGSVPEIVSLKKAKVESVVFSAAGAVLQLGTDGSAMLGEIYEIE